MTAADEISRAKIIAEQALEAMVRHGVPATPRNYAVWFAHAGGDSPELSRAIEALVATGQEFTAEQNDELFVRFIAAEAQAGFMHQAGLKLQSALTRILGVLEKASGDTRAYGERLDAFSAELDGEKSVEDLRAVVDGLISETHRVVAQNQKLQEKLQQSSGEIVELRRNLAVVQHEAMTDALTGIANRKYFDAQLRAAARDAIQTGETLSLLLIDIDHFKRFNDTYGHQLGDKVLRLVARTLTECVKGRDLTARFGGEEFAILLKKTRLEDAVAVADQIRAMMVRRKIVRRDSGDNLGVVTVSIGAAAYRPGEPVASMLRRADSALYFAKHNGRNRVASESEGGLKVIFASA